MPEASMHRKFIFFYTRYFYTFEFLNGDRKEKCGNWIEFFVVQYNDTNIRMMYFYFMSQEVSLHSDTEAEFFDIIDDHINR